MSDSLDKLEAYWRMQYQFTLPVVGAMFLVIIVYVLGVGSSPTPAPTLFENEELMSRKQKKAIEKKEKLKQKKETKATNNGHVKPAESAKPVLKQAKAVDAKAQKEAELRRQRVREAQIQAKKAEQEEAKRAMEREKKIMMKAAAKGGWTTVAKDKKSKQVPEAAVAPEPVVPTVTPAAVEASPEPAKKPFPVTLASGVRPIEEVLKELTSVPVAAALEPTASAKSKKKGKSSKPEPVEQPKVVAKQEVAAPVAAAPAVAASEPAPQQSKEESLQEKLADAMQPAFDEVGSWEEAKPLKMKNIKKRARRER